MQAPDRFSGYVSEVTFPDRFHRELSPAWLDYVSALGGVEPRDLTRPFAYLDLGCGSAHSTIVNAGAFPHAQFHACDFNPAHIEAAARRVSNLGVHNIALHEAAFDALLDRDLPSFDFIVLHGVYSWVDADARRTLLEILSRKLNDGGIVYLSYNCFPGWSAETPLRKLMLELSRAADGDVAHQVSAAVDAMQRLGNSGAKYFRDNPAVNEALKAISKDPVDYLAHEFLNDTWKVHYSVDVADEMADIGLTYVGSATLADNHLPLIIDKRAAESIATLASARLRHLAADFAVNRRFRRDVFVRRTQETDRQGDVVGHLDDAVVGCATDVEQIDVRVNIPRGVLNFQADFIGDLRVLMAEGSMRIGDIVTRLHGRDPRRNAMEIRQNVLFLVAAGALMPFANAGGYSDGTTRRAVNSVVGRALESIVESASPGFVPCERAGNGVWVTVDEAVQARRWFVDESAVRPDRLARLGLV
ncbi:class I SAM-dependent methyltransferase [Trinickia acidisoli]|uniref:class I SAM-dependent methyltransferase n=1 Tax=Trinickia acidisoli TaxID=2767482 RepID=UPI001A90BC8E|nr:class I SAM-dependent methyltransferase [Trinickia acidisoli]